MVRGSVLSPEGECDLFVDFFTDLTEGLFFARRADRLGGIFGAMSLTLGEESVFAAEVTQGSILGGECKLFTVFPSEVA